MRSRNLGMPLEKWIGKRAILVLCLPWLLSLSLSAAQEKPLKVFILIGQSNMVGKRSKIELLPRNFREESPAIQYFSRKTKTWQPLKPGITEDKGFGPEFSFARRMHETLGEPIGIIKLSVGGTNLYQKWNPRIKGSLYAQTVALYRKAAQERPIQAAGLVWVQGGADAKTKVMAEAYREGYRAFVAAWRRDLKAPALPVVCGRCGTSPDQKTYRKKKPYIDLIRRAQTDLKDPYYRCVDLDDVTTGPDNVHFDTSGMIDSGSRYARAMLELLKAPNK